MNTKWPNDTVHTLILGEASKLWHKSQRKSPWSRMLNVVFRRPVPNALYIQEYSGADWQTGECKGKLLGTWVFDDTGVRDSEPPALDPESHKQFERLIFHAPSQGDTLAFTHFYSPFGGFGHVVQVATRSGKPAFVAVKTSVL